MIGGKRNYRGLQIYVLVQKKKKNEIKNRELLLRITQTTLAAVKSSEVLDYY